MSSQSTLVEGSRSCKLSSSVVVGSSFYQLVFHGIAACKNVTTCRASSDTENCTTFIKVLRVDGANFLENIQGGVGIWYKAQV